MAGLEEESGSAGAIHVAQRQCVAAGSGDAVCWTFVPGACHQCVCSYLQQEYR